jgi:DNA-binding transcriptional LysR family regulator
MPSSCWGAGRRGNSTKTPPLHVTPLQDLSLKRTPRLNYHQVELLYEVIRLGTITAASKALHISQPAVTKQLKALEESLGIRFFIRSAGRLVPTAEAILLTQQIERTKSSLNALGDLANRLRHGTGGRISICAPPALADWLLLNVVALFHVEFPDVLVDIAIENTLRMLDLVETQQVDIALCNPFRTTKHISETHLLTSRILLAVPSNDPLAALSSVHMGQIAGKPLVVVDALENIPQVLSAIQASGLASQIACRVSNSTFACKMVLLNGSRALVDSVTAASFTSENIVYLEIPELPVREFAMLRPLMRPSSEVLDRFSSLLISEGGRARYNKPCAVA